MKIFELGCIKLHSRIIRDTGTKKFLCTRTTLFIWRFIFNICLFPYSVEYGAVLNIKYKILNIMFYPMNFDLGLRGKSL
jgi:hypothetical protein